MVGGELRVEGELSVEGSELRIWGGGEACGSGR